MKKRLLISFMLLLSIGLFPGKIFAQAVTGGSADGAVGAIDAGINIPASSYQTATPPSFVLTLKRNNGNGVCEGSAEARLNFNGAFSGWMQLVDIARLDTKTELSNSIIGSGNGTWKGSAASKYLSFCLNYNIPPKNKLIFHFIWGYPGSATTYQFWIPEL